MERSDTIRPSSVFVLRLPRGKYHKLVWRLTRSGYLMNKHAKAAVAAAKKLQNQKNQKKSKLTAEKAWGKVPPGCGRATFLGLANMGLIKGYKPQVSSNIRITKQGMYGILAIWILRSLKLMTDGKYLVLFSPKVLWHLVHCVLGKSPINHNSQMDVVLALWSNKLIK